MKAESESVTDDECVLRLIWDDYFKPDLRLPIQPAAFQPRESEKEGISVFREACLRSLAEPLAVIEPSKQNRYYIARLRIADLRSLGLSVKPEPVTQVAGHAVIPELNALDYKGNRPHWRFVQKQLAELASRDIVYRPTPRA